MISFEHRCIFIHIPKCGGTSVENALGHFKIGGGRGQQDHRTLRDLTPGWSPGVLRSRENLREFRRRFKARARNEPRVTSREFRTFYKFAFVRNPWARAYSWYRNVERDPRHRGGDRSAMPPFDEFLGLAAGRGYLRPQTYWLTDYSGRVRLDFIGRFERLSEDFDEVARSIGLAGAALPHLVKGDDSDYRQAYTPAAQALVARLFRREIELFGYEF